VKIQWLNDNCTECILTVGLFTKRHTILTREYSVKWSMPSGIRLDDDGSTIVSEGDVENARNKELQRRRKSQDWQPGEASTLPTATLYKEAK
jgi:hypothetical protein